MRPKTEDDDEDVDSALGDDEYVTCLPINVLLLTGTVFSSV